MGLRDKIGAWLSKRFSLKTPPEWFIDYFGGGKSSAGVSVGHQSALSYTPFWAGVRIISGTLAALPFKVYGRRGDGGKEPLAQHRIYTLIHARPNEYMDWITFAETRQAHVLCYGNGYAEIQRDGAGRPVALWPLLPNRTSRKMKEDGTPYYEVRLPAGEAVELPDYNVLHLKGLGYDGYTGYDVIQYHKDALGYGMAVKEYGARFFANDANPGGVLECPTVMSDKAYNRLKESWNEKHTGLSNAHRMQILEEGAKWSKIGVEPEKAQAIDAMKFTVDDCARILLIPPHKLMSMEFSKYANVYDLNNDFYCSAMLYWFRKWEMELNYKLLSPSEQGRLFVEILVDALLRGNIESRTQYYKEGRLGGWLCVDDIREKENMNPLPDGKGKIFLEPLNMKPAGSPAPKPAEPEPKDDPEDGPEDPVRSAHRKLLVAQWRRIITRQINATKKNQRDFRWEAQQSFAMALLNDPARAYGAIRGIDVAQATERLQKYVRIIICPDSHLTEDDSEWLAEDLMQEIGGNHALATA